MSVILSVAAKFLSPLTQLMTDTLTCTCQLTYYFMFAKDRELNIGTYGTCMCHVSELRGERCSVNGHACLEKKKVTEICAE